MAKIKNIHPHVGVSYKANQRKRVVEENNTLPILFAPFVADKGPANTPYKVYNNAEFISAFGSLDYAKQGQQVLNIGNWLNAGGAVLAYRMVKTPADFDIASDVVPTVFVKDDMKSYITVNGIVTDTTPGRTIVSYELATKYDADANYYIQNGADYVAIAYEGADKLAHYSNTGNTGTRYVLDSSMVYADQYVEGLKYYIIDSAYKYVERTVTAETFAKGTYYIKNIVMTPATYYSKDEVYYNFSATDRNVDNYLEFPELKLSANVAENTVYAAYDKDDETNNVAWVGVKLDNPSQLTSYYKQIVEYANDGPDYRTLENIAVAANSDGDGSLVVTGKPYGQDTVQTYVIMKSGNRIYKDDVNLLAAYYQSNDAVIKAKYPGSYYDGLQVRLTQTALGAFRIDVILNGNVVESYARRTARNYRDIIHDSDYIGDIQLSAITDGFLYKVSRAYTSSNVVSLFKTLKCGTKDASAYDTEFNEELIAPAIKKALEDKLSIKADYVLDAGYKKATKQAICDALIKEDGDRDDVIFIADLYESNYEKNTMPNETAWSPDELSATEYQLRNIAVYEQYLTTEDMYSVVSGSEVYVTPTYFLAGLIPYNEINYGVWAPNAGKKRGTINDALSLNYNPTLAKKDEWFENQINYIEKDSSSIQFMAQHTLETTYEALRYLNNSRTVNKMSRDIEQLGREYLFEDASNTTIRSLENAIVRYMNNWVQNRVLSKCEVEVYPDDNDDTLVHVILNIRFTGIIQMIQVEINID